ncbi:hypothetical protein U9M48_024740 [Paspalum notatum var. saurae]|uniref:Glabrous enhancer-binding protein-like DBD domain-containing protein n=1 Tax=Paspalum notatum var. saurae TaxID=547442 RepID=A0AAQ3TRC9_PASNO
MARKRRTPSPPPQPPPPPPQEESEEEEETSDSDSDTDAQAFQLRQVPQSPTKLPHPAQPQSDSDADEEEEEGESEPEIPEPVTQAAGKPKAEQERKRPAPDPSPTTGKAKKAKAGTEKVAATPPSKSKKGKAEPEKAVPEATLAGKAKKGKTEPEKVAPEAPPPGKGKKAATKLEKLPALDHSPADSKSDKPGRAARLWGKGDEMKILEALAAHVKSQGVMPKFDFLLTTIRDRLDRKNCTYTDIYEKVRRLKERYEKVVATGIVPSKEDELQMYNISEAIWGEKAKGAIAAATSQKDGGVTKSKKGQATKEKLDGNSVGAVHKEAASNAVNQNGDSKKGSKKGQAIKEKTDRDVKSRISKEATTAATPSKSKKQGNHSEELDKDLKDGKLKEATIIGSQNDSDLAKSKRGKADKGKMDIDTDSCTPKEATTNQNGGTQIISKEVETQDEESERDDNVQGMRRGFDELQGLYSNLALYVEEIEAHHPCGETLKRLFEFIGDDKAQALESKIKKYRVAETKVQIRRGDIQKEVLNLLLAHSVMESRESICTTRPHKIPNQRPCSEFKQ